MSSPTEKTRPTGRTSSRLLAGLFSLSLTACIGGNSPPAQFYLLEPLSEAATAPDDAQRRTVLLTPVRIPHYLDRAPIVTASGDNTYQLSELNRWAEGLDHNITRVLQQDLANLIPADVVSSAPDSDQPLKLSVSILAFHVDSRGQAILRAQWQTSRNHQVLVTRQQHYQHPSSTTDYRQIVAALNQCLNQLSRDLAATVRATP